MKKIIPFILMGLILSSCAGGFPDLTSLLATATPPPPVDTPTPQPTVTLIPTQDLFATLTATPITVTPTETSLIPDLPPTLTTDTSPHFFPANHQRYKRLPHASVSGRRFRAGDLVTIDFGAEVDGYYSDITRTVCVGRPNTRQREVHGLVLRAQQNAIHAVRPGIACAAINRAARATIEKAGRGKQFGHATGHGIGLMVHEAPTIAALSKVDIREGMVFTVEPGVYIPGWGGVRIEDMVLVTNNGYRVLTSLPREL